jgi:L-ascorbate metabolism protein UlaG (beta-lactamase superfamily)
VIPCHYGSFPIIDANADHFVEQMAGNSRALVIVPEKNVAFDPMAEVVPAA